ncbi:hypothetical protein RDI58_022355 [Solanum bulbocastanum]|uniref:Uncharacterized protein n=1 Tax=Solanum bulbocastanum TaxID=147425 RepID=A0AAN8TAF9_SOLBU
MEAGSYWNFVAKEKFENCQIEFSKLKILKVKGYKKLELEEKLLNILSKDRHLEIKSKDVVTVSKIVTVSTYYLYKDKSSVFQR